MKIGNREFDTGNNTYIMGILNITPDSFSDGGRFLDGGMKDAGISEVLHECDRMIKAGVDILDIGGESTRPGAMPVSSEEEYERVIPVVEAVKKEFDTVISVDTYKSGTAEAAVRAGADMINDIWGLKGDDQMSRTLASLISEHKDTAICIMHNRRPVHDGSDTGDEAVPATMHGEETDYGYSKDPKGDMHKAEELFIQDVMSDLADSVDIAVNAGISIERLIVDPGVGFAKTYEQNLAVIRRIGQFGCLKGTKYSDRRFPVLLGCSRKSVIGKALDRTIDKRLYGTLATTAVAALSGVGFVRVHDVEANADVIRMIRAIREGC